MLTKERTLRELAGKVDEHGLMIAQSERLLDAARERARALARMGAPAAQLAEATDLTQRAMDACCEAMALYARSMRRLLDYSARLSDKE